MRYATRLFTAAGLVAAAWLVPAARAADVAPSVERGQHLATAVTHCTGCHGADLGGDRSFPAGPGGGRLVAGNLTAGPGGVGKAYTDGDYVRAIRLGLRPDGTHLRVMPWTDFAAMTDVDVASVVEYIRSLPPVDRGSSSVAETGATTGASPGPPAAPAPAASFAQRSGGGTAAPGAYLARLGGCLDCHGADLHGTSLRGSVAPDISRSGIGSWTASDFRTAMRSGLTPDGRALQPPMPWRAIGGLTDAELDALYRYVESVPPKG